MDWLPLILCRLQEELQAAEAEALVRHRQYTEARVVGHAADARVTDLRRAILALQQLDPATTLPEVPQ